MRTINDESEFNTAIEYDTPAPGQFTGFREPQKTSDTDECSENSTDVSSNSDETNKYRTVKEKAEDERNARSLIKGTFYIRSVNQREVFLSLLMIYFINSGVSNLLGTTLESFMANMKHKHDNTDRSEKPVNCNLIDQIEEAGNNNDESIIEDLTPGSEPDNVKIEIPAEIESGDLKTTSEPNETEDAETKENRESEVAEDPAVETEIESEEITESDEPAEIQSVQREEDARIHEVSTKPKSKYFFFSSNNLVGCANYNL